MFPLCMDYGDYGRECGPGKVSEVGVEMGAWGVASIRGSKGRLS